MQQRFDDIFAYIGGFGPYQFTLFCAVGLAALTCSEVINMNFIGYIPDHWCYIEELANFPFEDQKKIAIPPKGDGHVFDSCNMYALNYSSYTPKDFLNWDPSRKATNQTTKCNSGWVYDRSVMVSNIVTEWDLVCGQEWKVQLISTIYMTGFLLGAVPCGLISDRIGRKVAAFGFMVIKVGACFLSTYAPNYAALAVGRFLVGFGSMGVYTIFFVLLVEIVGPQYRSLVGISFNVMLHIGYMTIAAFAYAIRDWVKLQLLMAGPACVLFLLWWVVPESPRWLVLQGRMAEAEKHLRFIASVNGQEIPAGFKMTAIRISPIDRPGGLSIIFKTGFLRKRTAILYFQWFTIDLLFYSFSLNTASFAGNVFLTTFLMAAVGIPAGILCVIGMNGNRLGRRLTSSLSLLLAGLTSMVSFLIILLHTLPEVATGMAVLGKGAITISMACAYVYTSELYPTAVRNAAVGSASMFARLSAMAAPYVGGPLGEFWPPLPSLIYAAFSITAGVLTLFLPETLGKSLQETMDEAEARNRGMSFKYVEGQSQNRMRNGCVTSHKADDIDADTVKLGSTAVPIPSGIDNTAFIERF